MQIVKEIHNYFENHLIKLEKQLRKMNFLKA